jgi:hypothetical protein
VDKFIKLTTGTNGATEFVRVGSITRIRERPEGGTVVTCDDGLRVWYTEECADVWKWVTAATEA